MPETNTQNYKEAIPNETNTVPKTAEEIKKEIQKIKKAVETELQYAKNFLQKTKEGVTDEYSFTTHTVSRITILESNFLELIEKAEEILTKEEVAKEEIQTLLDELTEEKRIAQNLNEEIGLTHILQEKRLKDLESICSSIFLHHNQRKIPGINNEEKTESEEAKEEKEEDPKKIFEKFCKTVAGKRTTRETDEDYYTRVQNELQTKYPNISSTLTKNEKTYLIQEKINFTKTELNKREKGKTFWLTQQASYEKRKKDQIFKDITKDAEEMNYRFGKEGKITTKILTTEESSKEKKEMLISEIDDGRSKLTKASSLFGGREKEEANTLINEAESFLSGLKTETFDETTAEILLEKMNTLIKKGEEIAKKREEIKAKKETQKVKKEEVEEIKPEKETPRKIIKNNFWNKLRNFFKKK